MDNKLIKTTDGRIWMDVTQESYALPRVFTLHYLFEKQNYTECLPVRDLEHHNQILKDKGTITIYVGELPNMNTIDHVTAESWEQADKIQHDGFIYVRYSDLRFCR